MTLKRTFSGDFVLGGDFTLDGALRVRIPGNTSTCTWTGSAIATQSTTSAIVGSYTMSDESTARIEFTVSMKGAVGVAKFGSWDGRATYERHGAAAPALVGSAEYGTPQRTVAGDSVQFDVSGNVVRVLVTADDSDVRNWSCSLRVQETLPPVSAPTLTTITPDQGTTAGGTSVSIVGTGFQAGAAVTFLGAAARSTTVVDSTHITAVTEAHAAGGGAVRVTNPDGQYGEDSYGFQYQ